MSTAPAESCLGVGALQVGVLQALWAAKRPLTVHEIADHMNASATKPLAYTTYLTVARNLAKRGLVQQLATPGERAHQFRVLVTRAEFQACGLAAFLELFFGGDTAALRQLLETLA